jgi:hypothetical protein
LGAPVAGPVASALYWHMGAIHIRFGMVAPRSVIGVNRLLVTMGPFGVRVGR